MTARGERIWWVCVESHRFESLKSQWWWQERSPTLVHTGAGAKFHTHWGEQTLWHRTCREGSKLYDTEHAEKGANSMASNMQRREQTLWHRTCREGSKLYDTEHAEKGANSMTPNMQRRIVFYCTLTSVRCLKKLVFDVLPRVRD